MEVDITDKGRDYLERMNQGEEAYDGYSVFDFGVLSGIVRDGPQDPDVVIKYGRDSTGPAQANGIKTAFRRMFEVGYIEEV